MSNRANFLIHLALAFLCVLLYVAHVAVSVYYVCWAREAYPALLAFVCSIGCLWLFVRMIIHCIAAVGREVEQQRRRRKQQEELAAAIDRGFERALARPLHGIYRPIHSDRKAA